MPADEPTAYERAITLLYERINYERTADSAPYAFRLQRMHEFLDRFDLHGIAGRDVPVVHIAGTKGKGSTASMVAAMLSAGGFRTGLYTSPHLLRLEERFTVDGQLATESEVVSLIHDVAAEGTRMEAAGLGAPTFFEFSTAMALLHFRRRDCRAVVLEVGLGGRLDSTNVCYPAVTAITSIGLDHQHILGHTLAEIASQKAGIIKPGVPVVSGTTAPDAADVIRETAERVGADLYEINRDFRVIANSGGQVTGTPSGDDEWTTRFDLVSLNEKLASRSRWHVALDGDHQAANASVACAMMDLLAERSGVVVPWDIQKTALGNMSVMGRVQRFRVRDGVDIILDTSHNFDSIAALCQCIGRRRQGRHVTIVFGTSRDKDHRVMLDQLRQCADALVLTRYHKNPRFREPEELLADVRDDDWTDRGAVTICVDPADAVRGAVAGHLGPHLIVVCGSFFLAAEVHATVIDVARGA